MSLGISGENCQFDGICMVEASYCAVLTAPDGETVAHRYLCELHAQQMFHATVNYGERLSRKVEAVKRVQDGYRSTFKTDAPFASKDESGKLK